MRDVAPPSQQRIVPHTTSMLSSEKIARMSTSSIQQRNQADAISMCIETRKPRRNRTVTFGLFMEITFDQDLPPSDPLCIITYYSSQNPDRWSSANDPAGKKIPFLVNSLPPRQPQRPRSESVDSNKIQ